MKIAVIVGSTRPGRLGEQVGRWVMEHAAGREGTTYELIDVADAGLPLLDEPLPAGAGRYAHEHTKAVSYTHLPMTPQCSCVPRPWAPTKPTACESSTSTSAPYSSARSQICPSGA